MATTMRQEGWSYSDISNQLNIPKSTLSGWFRSTPYTPNKKVQARIKTGQGTYGVRRHTERLAEVEALKDQGFKEVGEMSKRDLWMIGIGLWLGEGSKTIEQIRLVNSDPNIIRLFIRWLREICNLEDTNITIAMHLYPDSNEQACRQYWMSITQLPVAQFRKTQIDLRLDKKIPKIGKSSYGTLHVTVASHGNPEHGVRLHRKMMGWVKAVTHIPPA